MLAVAACGGGDKEKKPAATSGCDHPAGVYRTRFDAGVGQWLWFRFEVDPSMQKATLKTPSAFDEGAVLTIDRDPAACKASVIAKTKTGEVLASITLDPKTHKVTGKLRRNGAREGVELEGVHDPVGGAVASKRACLHPGKYQLVVPAEQEWMPREGCDNATIKVPFLVEEFGDKLSIDQLDDDGTAAWAAEDYSEQGECDVLLRFRHRDYTALTKLTFGGDKVTAAPIEVSVQVLDKGDTRRCRAASPMAWVEKI